MIPMSQRKLSNKNYTSCKFFITGYRTSRKKRYNLKNKHRKTLKCNLYFAKTQELPGGLRPLGPPPPTRALPWTRWGPWAPRPLALFGAYTSF